MLNRNKLKSSAKKLQRRKLQRQKYQHITSPHITIYKVQSTSFMSLMQRASGLFLFVSFIALCFFFVSAATKMQLCAKLAAYSANAATVNSQAHSLHCSLVCKFSGILFITAIAFHMLNGLRYVILYASPNINIKAQKTYSILALALCALVFISLSLYLM